MSKVKGQRPTTASLSVKELKTSEEMVVRYVQKQTYSDEMRTLQTEGKVKRSSHIDKFDPILSPERITVCRTRASSQNHPLELTILPKESHVSTLFVRYYHEMMEHSGRKYIVAEIRKRYWIPGVRTIVRRISAQCNKCRKLFSKPMSQRTSDLPSERLATKKPPFNHTGTDCFGPF